MLLNIFGKHVRGDDIQDALGLQPLCFDLFLMKTIYQNKS